MIFPDFLKMNDTIGVTAPSRPVEEDIDRFRFMNGRDQLKKRGYKVIFTPNVFRKADHFGRSSSGKEKARQFGSLVKNPRVKAIYSASGGDFLAEMLPFTDIDEFRENPKWVQGYSDNTSLLYYLTTKADVATAYGANFSDFGMEKWDLSVGRGLEILEGKCSVQKSFSFYQDGFGFRETGLEGYRRDAPVKWQCVTSDSDSCAFQGRLLGGCMDVLLNLAGTRYDGTCEFVEKYKDDGIIWYLESFDLHFEQMMEGLWKMKELGWFEHVAGFIFGRPLFYASPEMDMSEEHPYEEVLLERLSCFNVPIITGADIGHKGPQFVMINGAKAAVKCENGRGSVEYIVG